MVDYKTDLVYQALEEILQNAGMKIIYEEVPDDRIDGAIWARSDYDKIMMPKAPEAFPDPETACCILGHEAGHILSGIDSPDIPSLRRKNEAVCDLIGCYLYELALRTAEKKQKDIWVNQQ